MVPYIRFDHPTPAPVPELRENPAAFSPTSDLFSLAGCAVVITGVGRGLGMTFRSAVLEAGGKVACLDLLPEPSSEEWITVQKLAKSCGLQATYTKCDVTDEEAVKDILDCCQCFGPKYTSTRAHHLRWNSGDGYRLLNIPLRATERCWM